MKKATISGLPALSAPAEEAMRNICGNLAFAGKNLKMILCTGADSPADKGHVLLHMAKKLAEGGKRVVLVDADLRQSDLTDRYRIILDAPAQGLAHYGNGLCDITDIVYETDLPGVSLVPVGVNAANPSLIFAGQEFADLMALCREQYDICLVNASPIDTVTDAVEIARQCDCALFIAQHRKTHAWALSAARQQLEAVPCPVIGCVVADAKKTAPYA